MQKNKHDGSTTPPEQRGHNQDGFYREGAGEFSLSLRGKQAELKFPEVKASGINLSLTIQEGRDIVRDRVVEGIKCPCCDQLVKLRQRSISIAHVYFLSNLFGITVADKMLKSPDLSRGQPYFIDQRRAKQGKAKTSTDYNILKYWGFTKPMPRNPGEKSAGFWALTELGLDFLCKRVRADKYKYTFDSRVFPAPGHRLHAQSKILVSDIVKGFDYEETLMNY